MRRPISPPKAFLLLHLRRGGINGRKNLEQLTGVAAKKFQTLTLRDLRDIAIYAADKFYPIYCFSKKSVRCATCGGRIIKIPCVLCTGNNERPKYRIIQRAKPCPIDLIKS